MPIGTIQVTVCYRTSMTLMSQQDPIMLKSDHFRKEYSPRHNQMIKTPMYVYFIFLLVVSSKITLCGYTYCDHLALCMLMLPLIL